MPTGPGPALITTASIPQQPQPQQKPMQQQPPVYHYEALPTQPPQNPPPNGKFLLYEFQYYNIVFC